MFIAAIYAVSCIKFKADQVVSGAAINILMIGIPGFSEWRVLLSSGSTPQIPKDHLLPQIADGHRVAILVLVAAHLVRSLQHAFGLRLRSVGENPEAADAAGVSVSADQILRACCLPECWQELVARIFRSVSRRCLPET